MSKRRKRRNPNNPWGTKKYNKPSNKPDKQPIKQPVIPITKPKTFASIIKESISKSDEPEYKSKKNEEYTSARLINTNYKPKCVRNYVPRKIVSGDYDEWERVYAEHLLELKKIFLRGYRKLINDDKINIDFEYFGSFIFFYSSKEISPYIEDLSPFIENKYIEYTIKRNNN